MKPALLEAKDLRTYFFTRWGTVKAVDGVSFTLNAGETLGLVGESGCGKSVTSFSIVRMVPEPAGRIVGGEILLDGEDLLKKSAAEMRHIRGGQIAMILQDPMTCLNPVFTVGDQVFEALASHQKLPGDLRWKSVIESLRMVEIPSPEVRVHAFPHQLSGGMRQRVVGAIAISCKPRLLIADEATTSLDVTIQLQYLKLLRDLQSATGLAILFITHDFGIVANMCDRVAVMYAGRIVEQGAVREIFNSPQHPYTRALIRSIPSVDSKTETLDFIHGEPPPLHRLAPGCAFRPRCTVHDDSCREGIYPPEREVSQGHRVSCWRIM